MYFLCYSMFINLLCSASTTALLAFSLLASACSTKSSLTLEFEVFSFTQLN